MGIFSFIARAGLAVSTGGTSEIIARIGGGLVTLAQSIYFWWALSLAVVGIGTWWHVSSKAEEKLNAAITEINHAQEEKIAGITRDISARNALILKDTMENAAKLADEKKTYMDKYEDTNGDLAALQRKYNEDMAAHDKDKTKACPVIPASVFKKRVITKEQSQRLPH